MSENRLELSQAPKLSQGLQTALRLLSGDLDDLTASMREAMQENPALELVPPPGDAPEIAVRLRIGPLPRGKGEVPAASHESQMDSLRQQLRLADLTPEVRRAALGILGSLNPRGYFITPLREYAAETGIPPEVVKQAVHAVQALEPTGVGARDVAECLTLQLAALPDADPLCAVIVRGYLMELARRDWASIARETGASAARVRRCADVIRSLNPAPVSLRDEPVRYIVPEFAVEQDEAGSLTAVFVSGAYPSLRIDPEFSRLAASLSGDGELYIRQMLASASQLIRAIDLRQSTMERVARLILREQRAFFLSESSVVPLRCDEAARELGVSESTVYRALQNKYLYCSRGTYPLSHFFPRAVSGGASAERIRGMIEAICREEQHYSDREIAQALAGHGISISRRTVAKYRSQLNIDSSYRRSTAGK